MSKRIMVDPPMGSKYGFPKIADGPITELAEEWFVQKGYPRELIDKGMLEHCRWWEVDDGELR